MSDLIADYLGHLSELSRAAATIETYELLLRRLDRDLPMGLLSACTDELRSWIYVDGRQPATRAQYRSAVCGFFAWACDPDEQHLDYNPARRLPLVRVPEGRPRPVDAVQLATILATAPAPYRAWYVIASHSGARCCEIAQLRREHITERDTLLKGKGGKSRLVPTHPLIWQIAQDVPAGLIAGGRTRTTVSNLGNKCADRLGFPEVTMHRLRATFLTEAFDVCKDIRAVQRLAGHASVNTTQRYVESREGVARLAVAGLPPVA